MARMARMARAGSSTGRLEGWPLFGGIALLLLAMSGVVLAVAGTGEEGVRTWIRATARSSLLLFSLAFSASALRRVWPVAATSWLVRNRRQLGVSFAFSHVLHLAGIVALATRFPASFEAGPDTLVIGGLGYVFIALMAATSNDAAVAWLGRRWWGRLHRVGGWFVWLVFLTTFGSTLAGGGSAGFYAPLLGVLLVVAALRIGVRLWPRRASASAPA
jgi:sulfoxide reductase heme-binding subunit YedZ